MAQTGLPPRRCPRPHQARRGGALHPAHDVGSPASQNGMYHPCYDARFMTTAKGLSPVVMCGEMLCPVLTPHFLAQICPRHVVSFISILAKKSAHKGFCRARAPRGHATRSSCTVRAGKSMVSRYRRSRCVPRSISWPGTKVASTRRVSPSKGKSTR